MHSSILQEESLGEAGKQGFRSLNARLCSSRNDLLREASSLGTLDYVDKDSLHVLGPVRQRTSRPKRVYVEALLKVIQRLLLSSSQEWQLLAQTTGLPKFLDCVRRLLCKVQTHHCVHGTHGMQSTPLESVRPKTTPMKTLNY